MVGMHPNNQVPALSDYNLYASDPVLRQVISRYGADWRDAELMRQGAEYGAADTLQAAEDANVFDPSLHIYSATGDRIDQVRFHPSWHEFMRMARRNGNANLPMFDDRRSAWAAYAASLYMHGQIEAGSCCPTSMTKASIPLLHGNAPLWSTLEPLLASMDYDARDIPLADKRGITVGMGMTERAGGSDLRSNTTTACTVGQGDWGDEALVNGHKWFFSAPMCDGHLVLARHDEDGLTCYFVPRWRPDGSKNGVHIQRLKDKVGNRSNSSSEVEFHDAWGVRVGEPGRGIATTIKMASHTRLDCVIMSAGIMRQGFAQALHHARNRFAFGRLLAEQPVMTALLADMALEAQATLLLGTELAVHHAAEDDLDVAWSRILTPAGKFWGCKRSIAFAGEAMEVFGGNGYVETGPMGRLYREAPVNSIWEGSGNVMCLDVLRAISRQPEHAWALLDGFAQTASQEPVLAAQVQRLRTDMDLPAEQLERRARDFTQRLILTAQACLMLEQASDRASAAFVASRFDPDWGAVFGARCGTDEPAALLAEAWAG